METYILQILEKNNRVIVPEFGAFIVKQRNPLTIVFNEFLQYNDGMLVDFVAQEEGITKDQSKDKIDKFIEDVGKSLKKNNIHSLGELGNLKKSPAGKISIEKADDKPASEKKATPIAAKKEPVKAAPKEAEGEDKPPVVKKPTTTAASAKKTESTSKAKTAASEKEVKPVVSGEKTEAKKDEEKPAESAKKATPNSGTTKGSAVSGTTTAASTGKTSASVKKETDKVSPPAGFKTTEKPPVSKEMKDVPKKETISGPSTSTKEVVQTEKKKKKRAHVLLWIILIVLINAFLIISYVFFPDEFEDAMDTISEKVETIFDRDSDSEEDAEDFRDTTSNAALAADEGYDSDLYSEDETSELHPEELESSYIDEAETGESANYEADPSYSASESSGRYWVIAGAFYNENYANNKVSELRAEGYNALKKYSSGSGYFYVCFGAFDNFSEAQALMNTVRNNNVKDDAWVKKW